MKIRSRLHHPVMDWPEIRDEVEQANRGTINTPNGEISDRCAWSIAARWCSAYHMIELSGEIQRLCEFADGVAVDTDKLLDDISFLGRRHMSRRGWPSELEHLSTWVLNYGKVR